MFTVDYFYLTVLSLEIIGGVYLLYRLFSNSDKKRDKIIKDHEENWEVKEDILMKESEPTCAQLGKDIIDTRKESMDLIEQGNNTIANINELLKQRKHNIKVMSSIMDEVMDAAHDLRYQSALDTNARCKKFGRPPKYNQIDLWKLKNAKNIRHKETTIH